MQKDTPYDVHTGYFQIQDQLALDYRPANAPTEDQTSHPEQSPLLGLLGELHLLDHESQHLLRQVGERDRNLAAYLNILSKRVDLIGRAIALQMTDEIGPPVAVTLSEAGLGFSACHGLEVDSWISLRLLLPAPVGLSITARIVDCVLDNASGQYWIQISFEQLNDAQRQLLARHIVQKQAQEIRAAKNNERTST